MRRRRLPPSMGCLVLVAVALAACSSPPTAANEPVATYNSNNARTGFMTDSSINPANVATLKQRWAIPGSATISAQPVIAAGKVYWGDWNGIEHATSTSGKALWATSVGRAPKPPGCPFPLGDLGVTSSATVGQGKGPGSVELTIVWADK